MLTSGECVDVESCPMAKNDLAEWLQAELDKRGWSANFLAERANIPSAVMSRLMRKEREPSVDTVTRLARGLSVPIETVMRHAGWLPLTGEMLPEVREWNERLMALSEEDRAAVIAVMEQTLLLMEMRPEYRARRGRKAGPGSTG